MSPHGGGATNRSRLSNFEGSPNPAKNPCDSDLDQPQYKLEWRSKQVGPELGSICPELGSLSQHNREVINDLSKRCRNDVDVGKIPISAPLLPLLGQNCGAEIDI